MNPPRNSITADRGHNKPTPKCVVCFVEKKSANHTIPEARRGTPQAAHGEIQCARKVRGRWVVSRAALLRELGA